MREYVWKYEYDISFARRSFPSMCGLLDYRFLHALVSSNPSNVPGTLYRFLNSPAPEYPINEYMVIHDPGSNTVNNILMLGRLLRSVFHSKMSFTISYKAYVIEPLYENRQAVAIQF